MKAMQANCYQVPMRSRLGHKALIAGAMMLLSLTIAAGAARAVGLDHHDGYRAGDYATRQGGVESKIYGVVETMPPELVGTWAVNGREIVVTKDTLIKERHGKVEVGAYVEVEGTLTDKTFTAFEVKVKEPKRIPR